jgi:hypothetical protein
MGELAVSDDERPEPAALKPTLCPYCQGPMRRWTRFLNDLDAVVLVCRPCNLWGVENDPERVWLEPHMVSKGDVKAAVRQRAIDIKAGNRLNDVMTAIMTSSIHDPRWIGLEVSW